jgi:hypothetical protein
VHYLCCLLAYIDPCALLDVWSSCVLYLLETYPFLFLVLNFVFLRAYLQETGRIMATMDLDGDGTV